MTGPRTPSPGWLGLAALTLVAVFAATALGSCDAVFSGPGPNEGQSLEVIEHADVQPAARQDYAELATFVMAGRLVFFRPGTGADDPPELVREILIPGVHTWDAQTDRDGFVWVATPDADAGGSIREMYVVDPHEARVHRVVQLPKSLRAAAAVFVTDRGVFIQSWRNGFEGGVGVIDRACVAGGDCRAELLTDLGPVGVDSETPFLLREPYLYSFRGSSSQDDGGGIAKIRLPSGEIEAEWPSDYAPPFVTDGESLFMAGFFEGGVNSLVRVDVETLKERGRVPLPSGYEEALTLMASYDGEIYLGGRGSRTIEVRSMETLEIVRAVDITAAAEDVTSAFGFVAPGLLMLSERDFVDVRTGEVLSGVFPPFRRSLFVQPVRMPEGHPFAR